MIELPGVREDGMSGRNVQRSSVAERRLVQRLDRVLQEQAVAVSSGGGGSRCPPGTIARGFNLRSSGISSVAPSATAL
jgi:hypothetical protein